MFNLMEIYNQEYGRYLEAVGAVPPGLRKRGLGNFSKPGSGAKPKTVMGNTGKVLAATATGLAVAGGAAAIYKRLKKNDSQQEEGQEK